jgi:drug/metabolite transporter (DMT)-like permease
VAGFHTMSVAGWSAATPATAMGPDGPLGRSVLIAVLGGAVLHAGWNAIAHGIADGLVGFTLIGLAHTGVSAVVVLVTGLPQPAAWPFIVASAGVHVVYQLTLMASYQLGEFSQVYPLARGTSPWLVAVISMTAFDQHLPLMQLAGILVISSGIISLVFVGGPPRRVQLPALVAACGTGVLIATYTLIDSVGVHTTQVLEYAGWLFLLEGPVVPLAALAIRRGSLLGQLRPSLLTGLVGGIVSLAAYGLVLWALTQGVAAPIAALRETSIIVGALIGATIFKERLGHLRAVASVAVVMGVVMINLH